MPQGGNFARLKEIPLCGTIALTMVPQSGIRCTYQERSFLDFWMENNPDAFQKYFNTN